MEFLKALLLLFVISGAFSASAQSVQIDAKQCKPDVIKRPSVVGMAVHGELSGFDPCHSSVSFRIPPADANTKKPPLLIAVHGGNFDF
jgi:hypothetical protein